MLVVDNLAFAPVRGLMWVFREVQKAAEQALRDEYETITSELGRLHLMLERQEISEQEFDRREKQLLDRMDELEEQGYGRSSEH
ncbi:gas vesicle protein GvpG [Methylococcus sp. Mc7]|uniref:gas vesicle protein GvpG n=1 Tax=Methylococcus sp. Mc7 TaxID=2860258 RepID=UPI001C52EB53|nr:gas vesicle protein GvpG [Methylococcus sp. Mc7]QXP83338.1 gas vesicle protein GvpG [Methylococcus sp. Mc7]